jgi:hypothetical protein
VLGCLVGWSGDELLVSCLESGCREERGSESQERDGMGLIKE